MQKKNLLSWLSIVCLLSYTTIVNASELKIGILDTQSLEAAPQYNQMKEKLKKEFKPRQDKLQAENKVIEEKQRVFERDRDVLSEKERVSKERELNKLRQEFQLMVKEVQDDFRLRDQEEAGNLRDIFDKAIAEVAKREKYDLILPNEVTVYSTDTKTFTDLVLKELKK